LILTIPCRSPFFYTPFVFLEVSSPMKLLLFSPQNALTGFSPQLNHPARARIQPEAITHKNVLFAFFLGHCLFPLFILEDEGDAPVAIFPLRYA